MADGGKKVSGSAGARAKTAAFRIAEQRAARRRRATVIAAVAALVIAAVVAIAVAVSSGGSSTPSAGASASGSGKSVAGPEGLPLEQGDLLASSAGAATGATVQGVQCSAAEQVAYHIHAHLAVYVKGAQRPVPGGIGVVAPVAEQTKQGAFYGASRCYYWLHTHAQDGVIHVEAPSQTTYTLGQFFAIWNQKLTATTVGDASGKLTVYVNGKRITGDPAAIVLRSHEAIQLDVGSDVPPKAVDWSTSTL